MNRIKIRELSRELGVTSRAVVDHCREVGLPVQNSISKLTMGQADQIRVAFAAKLSGVTSSGEDDVLAAHKVQSDGPASI